MRKFRAVLVLSILVLSVTTRSAGQDFDLNYATCFHSTVSSSILQINAQKQRANNLRGELQAYLGGNDYALKSDHPDQDRVVAEAVGLVQTTSAACRFARRTLQAAERLQF